MSAYPPRAASFIGDKVRRFDRLKLNLAILAILILICDLVPETIILNLILINQAHHLCTINQAHHLCTILERYCVYESQEWFSIESQSIREIVSNKIFSSISIIWIVFLKFCPMRVGRTLLNPGRTPFKISIMSNDQDNGLVHHACVP